MISSSLKEIIFIVGILRVSILAFSTSSITTTSRFTFRLGTSISSHNINDNNNLLILDHWNINHERGRQDWLVTFWVDFLKCALDPRKLENLVDPERRTMFQLSPLSHEENNKKKKGTLWMNIGAHQFHLPQGKPEAQILDGSITLVYPNLQSILDRYDTVASKLQGSKFHVQYHPKKDLEKEEEDHYLQVTDPWGSCFYIVEGTEYDPRGRQAGEPSEGLALRDITIHVPQSANLPGIGRFYQRVLGTETDISPDCVTVYAGPFQTLTFRPTATATVDSHVDLKVEEEEERGDDGEIEGRIPIGTPIYPSNYGPHVSMYVADLTSTYQRAKALGVTYVNPRFSRRAYTLEEVQKDCMFRCLNIVDPDDIMAGPIVQLEHEIRSVIRMDGTKYKSCPFDEIPVQCQ